jgi:hypothetical protein
MVKDADKARQGPLALVLPVDPESPHSVLREVTMIDFLLGFAFVAMILSPAVFASWQRARTHNSDN